MFASKQELSSALRHSFWLSFAIGIGAANVWLFGWVILAVVLEMNEYIHIPQTPRARGQGRGDGLAWFIEHPVYGVAGLLVLLSTFGVFFWVNRFVLHRWGVACPQCDCRPDHKAMQQMSQTGCCIKCSRDLVSSASGSSLGDNRASINAVVDDPTSPSPGETAAGAPIRGTDRLWLIVAWFLGVSILAVTTCVLTSIGEVANALAAGLWAFLILAGGGLALGNIWHPLPWRLVGAAAFLAAVVYMALLLQDDSWDRATGPVIMAGLVGGYFAIAGRIPLPRGGRQPRGPEEKDKEDKG